MLALSVDIEGQEGLTWPRWRQIVAEVEALGFAGLCRSDHFLRPFPPDADSLELVVSLAHLADHTRRVWFGPLVAPVSFRDPVMLARQAAALDDLSGGRMVLGLGAGWIEREHQMFGYTLGDIATRLARFEEALIVISRLLRDETPVTFDGRFYQLRDATLLPRPTRPGGPPLLIGGNGIRRTLPLVAQYADIWNGIWLTPEAFRERSARLDDLLTAADRDPDAVRRTLMLIVLCGRDDEERARRIRYLRRFLPGGDALPLDEAIQALRTRFTAIIGTPDEVAAQVQEYADAGVTEVMLQWFDLEDLDGVRVLADEVMPRLANDARA
jgi:F420-dependent oxidoreductase-like protein